MKINNFNGGTLITKHNHLEYIVNIDLCHITDLNDIQHDLTKNNNLYLDVKDINKEGDYIHITYNTDSEYRPFSSAKRESKALKLSLLDYILEVNPLNENYTVLHPSNLFFRNIKDIKIGYKGHDLMPKMKMSNLEQYKILVMSMLSKYPYEKFIKNKFEALSKENNIFFHKVNNAESLLDLQNIVRDELSDVQTKHLLEEEIRHKKLVKKSRFIIIAGLLTSILLCSLIAMSVIRNVVAENENEYSEKMKEAEIAKSKNSVYENLYNGNFKEALKGMKKDKSFARGDVISVLKNENAYEELIKYEPKETEYVIEKLYEDKKVDKIRELAFEFENNEALSVEKAIIDREGSIFSVGATGTYNEQSKRLAETAVENGYIEVATDINKKLKDKNLEKKINERKIEELKKEIKNTKDKAKKAQLREDIKNLSS